jgi:Cys-tRNA(Pro) deacylase
VSVRYPATPVTRLLESHKVAFTPHLFEYVEKGGTRHSSAVLGVPEHIVIKTLLFERADKKPICVLMHGDQKVSEKALARALGERQVRPCDPAVAERHSGYKVGGTSPFGLRAPMPIAVEATILELPEILINGGRRGFLVALSPIHLALAGLLTPVAVALPRA